MDHRHSARKPVHLHVVIRCYDGTRINARARNVSATGMCVDLPHRTAFTRNSIVTIEFNDGDIVRSLAALVIQAGPDGLGLMFAGDRDDTRPAPGQLLINANNATH